MNVFSKFVAFTHSKTYMAFIIHAPLAAAIVLYGRSWWCFSFAATIGLWKNLVLDMKFQPDAVFSDEAAAAGFYVVGALLGALGAGLI